MHHARGLQLLEEFQEYTIMSYVIGTHLIGHGHGVTDYGLLMISFVFHFAILTFCSPSSLAFRSKQTTKVILFAEVEVC